MTWRQFFYPERWGIRYTWKLTLMRTIVAELILWAALFLLNLSLIASLALLSGLPFTNVPLATWRGTWLLFVPLSPVPPLVYVAVAWHFNRRLQRVQATGLGFSASEPFE